MTGGHFYPTRDRPSPRRAVCIAREKVSDRARGQTARRGFPPGVSDRASHGARSARATLANAHSSPVGRPNARLRRTRRRASWLRALPRARAARARTCSAANHVKRRRAVEASIRPTSVRRACMCATFALARGRRALHGSVVIIEVIATSGTSAARRSGASPRTASPLPPDVDVVIVRVHRNCAVADAAPRSCSASAIWHRVGAAQLSAVRRGRESLALATPRAAA